MQVTELQIDRHGQGLLIPDVEVEGRWISLVLVEEDVMMGQCVTLLRVSV